MISKAPKRSHRVVLGSWRDLSDQKPLCSDRSRYPCRRPIKLANTENLEIGPGRYKTF
jgi:hypothetical protein